MAADAVRCPRCRSIHLPAHAPVAVALFAAVALVTFAVCCGVVLALRRQGLLR